MPKLRPLPPEFRAIRDEPDLTEDEKIDAVWELLAQCSIPLIRPPGTSENEFDLNEHRERTFYQARRDKNGKLRAVAIEPEKAAIDGSSVSLPGRRQRADEFHVAFRQNALAVPYAVLKIQIA